MGDAVKGATHREMMDRWKRDELNEMCRVKDERIAELEEEISDLRQQLKSAPWNQPNFRKKYEDR